METITEKYVRQYIKPRNAQTHKGDYGRVLIIAGSLGMGGAAIMCGKAALRSGAGLVTLSVPSELFTAVHSALPEATCIGRPISIDIDFSKYDAIAVGPGLGTDIETSDLLSVVLRLYKGKLILDADALNVIARNNIPLKESKADIITTPHPGEAARLLHTTTAKINESREASAKELAVRHNAVAVLKGHETIVAAPKGNMMINTTGNPGMATGGAGDVLTGIIAALAAQGLSVCEAARCGVYLHGLAGDIATGKLGEYSLIAGDIIDYLPQAFLSILF